jgi:hypothetical protein
VLSRRNLADASRHSNPNPRRFNSLQPLSLAFPTPVLCFQQLAASFRKTPGVGVPLREFARCTEAQKSLFVSPFLAIHTQTPGIVVSRLLSNFSRHSPLATGVNSL